MEIWPGSAYPLGATFDGTGTNFALFSERAEKVELCLFDDDGVETRFPLPEVDGYVWHGYLPESSPASTTATASTGRTTRPPATASTRQAAPGPLRQGRSRARSTGTTRCSPTTSAKAETHQRRRLSARTCMHGRGHQPLLRLGRRPPPRRPCHESVIYEAHVKGLTKLHPEVPEELRGTYAGVAHPAVIAHLQTLGVTAIELHAGAPVRRRRHPAGQGPDATTGATTPSASSPRTNGTAPPATPASRCRSSRPWSGRCTAAGIEVILDVVYNHTAEGNHLGPTLSFKGIDNPAYYRLVEDDRATTWTTPARATRSTCVTPTSLQLIMDSLRYWVTEMHVDGFRFDLASTLARELHDVDKLSAFFDLIQQDPVVSQVKLIAEPWDVGEGGYQVGNFPPQWAEWNGKYRDTVRDFWRGETGHARRIRLPRSPAPPTCTSTPAAGPAASINFVTAHDGFTLHDLVSYNEKHNDANGEDNNDGESHNRSWNCGAEGPTDDPEVLGLRARGSSATSSPSCCCPRVCRCCCTATNWAAPSRATTTATARTPS